MGWLFKAPRRIWKRRHSENAEKILKRLQRYLNDESAKPVELLCGFWKDQQEAITYQELRVLVEQGYLDEVTARIWQQDYSILVKERMPKIWGGAMIAGSVSQPIMDRFADTFTLNTQTPSVVQWIRSRSAALVTVSTQTQKDAIALLLEDKIRNAHTADELARLIRPCIGLYRQQAAAVSRYYDNLVKNLAEQHPRTNPASIQARALDRATKYAERLHRQRALNIARTEMAFAYNYGADEGIRQAQADYLIGKCIKRWCTAGDGSVCEECAQLDGKEIGMEDLFFSGNKVIYDESGLFPPLHPNCACAVEYIEVEPPRMPPAQQAEPQMDMATQPQLNAQTSGNMAEYMGPDGSFDLSRAITDYEKFLQSVPERNRIYLEQALNAVRFEKTDITDVVFGYLPSDTEISGKIYKGDTMYFNPGHHAFYRYDFNIVATHELGHRIDHFFVQSWKQHDFTKAIAQAAALMEKGPELFMHYCEEHDDDGFLSDIMSGICKGKHEFPADHAATYWILEKQAKEIFTNLFALESYHDVEKLDFLEEHFPNLMKSFHDLEFSI